MPARTGNQYLNNLKCQPSRVWLDGMLIEDVTSHSAFKRGAASLADLYDLQHRPELTDEMTFVSPTSGERVGLSFIVPRSIDDLERRRGMMLHWARSACGMLGRSPDFMNVNFTAWGAAASYFGSGRAPFAENIARYVDYIRENDLVLTHALINLRQRRNDDGRSELSPDVALHIARETDSGIIVRGSRILATLGPLADELAIYSPRISAMKAGEEKFVLNFAIPCNTAGLEFLCRESFDYNRSRFDHPLGSRFEEMDAIAIFNDVLVPWERVFVYRDAERLNNAPRITHSFIHTAHQGAARALAKSEFLLGLALLISRTLGTVRYSQTIEYLSELVSYTEIIKAAIRASEADATLDQWGVMCPAPMPLESVRNLFMTWYPRMVEIIQLMGGGSILATPSEADLGGPLAGELESLLATDTMTGRERIKIFRLAWDVACSAFGSRQVLYERFYAGDSVSRAMFLYDLCPNKEELAERVLASLANHNSGE